jgi:hypothetical protein
MTFDVTWMLWSALAEGNELDEPSISYSTDDLLSLIPLSFRQIAPGVLSPSCPANLEKHSRRDSLSLPWNPHRQRETGALKHPHFAQQGYDTRIHQKESFEKGSYNWTTLRDMRREGH